MMSQEVELLSHTFRTEHWLFNEERFDRKLVGDFLILYSRAEYALKVAGFLQDNSRDKLLKANWASFIGKLPNRPPTSQDQILEKAVTYLTRRPPKSQWLNAHGRLEWRERPKRSNETLTAFLLRAVSEIRNNLFHGGKDLRGELCERDAKLLDSAIVVLRWALTVLSKVRDSFDDSGPDIEIAVVRH